MLHRLLISGDRNWGIIKVRGAAQASRDIQVVHAAIVWFIAEHPTEIIINGGARGADSIAVGVAQKLGIDYKTYMALWDVYGKRAGHLRNMQMLEEGNPTYLLAFHDNIQESRGTRDMVTRAKNANIPYIIISNHPSQPITPNPLWLYTEGQLAS